MRNATFAAFAALALLLCLLGYAVYRVTYRPNVPPDAGGAAWLYIRTGTGFEAVLDTLNRHRLLRETAAAHGHKYESLAAPFV